jgi:hypothetical protein
MQASVLLRRTLGAAAAAGLLAGCAATSHANLPSDLFAPTQVSGQTSLSLNPAVKRSKSGLIYVADDTNSEIHIYPLRGKNQKQLGSITGVPVVEYLNVDRWHNLYVVEFSAGKVLVYPKGATQPSLTLTVDPSGAFPNAVAISHTGEVAVGQFQTNGINFYHKGTTTPYNLVPPPAGFSAGFCAYDASGNLYVILSRASGPSHIGEIVGGGSGKSTTDLGVNTGITNAKGIQVDKDGNLGVVGDDGTLNVYAAGSNTLLSSAKLLDPPNDGPSPNGGFSLLKSGRSLYVASAILDGNLGQAYKYAYPAGGNILNTITVEPPASGSSETAVTGVAVDPPEHP